MKRWAVAFMTHFDNELTIEIVSAPDWRSALFAHSKTDGYELTKNATLERAKEVFFDCDAAIDVVEID